jgi:hypothetical protein
MIPYFAYGTTQQGFTHHRRLGLGEPAGRYRTVAAHAVVVPRRAACSNPGASTCTGWRRSCRGSSCARTGTCS